MLHCPYCGTSVHIEEDELFCIHCGKKLPSDMHERANNSKKKNKYWLLPLFSLILSIIAIGIYHLMLQNQITDAKEAYNVAEQAALEENYEEAMTAFNEALDHHSNFNQAAVSLEFVKKAIDIQDLLIKANSLSDNGEFQQALALLTETEQELKDYTGDAVNELIHSIQSHQETIKMAKISDALKKEPTIDELKILLWESESVGQEAEDITESIRHQIIDYSFTKASELINEKQFREATLFVEDGMKYAPNSEKLMSIKTTIEKEKVAFETAEQQRIEQAMSIAQEDYELNETDVVELVSATLKRDKQGNLVVNGEVKSVAEMPINSILVEYSLLDNGNEMIANEVFVYPDTLYPNESGNFEFTHFNTKKMNELELKVTKITWYTD
ncbi:zinc ribbon domain-containing protein [Oceanobacillus bengalensis]|uniref:Zinc ribbon domain-containing protein n=2 Tax=Oceanobacillus bengalensis TaxID=1435466 RepID=A0A494Z1M1_9BACI|nr:zinc ribbon domain-containing protein [Oceanobacillus bengalensis]RKQ16375.1 zinc ribbon domain-containing protein [Oceanobacillus bengalensis]